MDWVEVMWGYAPALAEGVKMTLFISIVTFAISVVLALLVALGRMSSLAVIRWPLNAYVEVARGTPLIIQLFIVYFGLPTVGITFVNNAVVAGITGLTFNITAYLSEVFRAAIIAIGRGQRDAALSLGMGRVSAFRRVVLPQALAIAIPTAGGYYIALLKDSALVSFISVVELMRAGMMIVSTTFRAWEVYLSIAGLYMVLSFGAARLTSLAESYLQKHRRPVLEKTPAFWQPRTAAVPVRELVRETSNGSLARTPIITAKGVTKRFGNRLALNKVDFEIARGEVTVVIGPSGGGKSTLLRCINLLELPDEGAITFDGKLLGRRKGGRWVERVPPAELHAARAHMPMVFQHFNLFPHMTVLDNVTEGRRTVLHHGGVESRRLGMDLLEKVGIPEKWNQYPEQLSGGQQQRVGIARALAMQPKVILFDEPTSSLDPEVVGEVLETMRTLVVEGLTMIVVTHEMAFARQMADTVYFLETGEVRERGRPEQILGATGSGRTHAFVSALARDPSAAG